MKKNNIVMRFFFLLGFYVLTFFRRILSFVSGGEICIVCGKKSGIVPLCRNCIKTEYSVARAMAFNVCSVCGKKLVVEKGVCTVCRDNAVVHSVDRVVSLYDYRLWNKDLLFFWKILGLRGLSSLFASFVCEAMKLAGETVVVPVPPRKGKIRKKGWDQIDDLCKFLKYRDGVCVMPLLVRNTVSEQKKLDREGRLNSIGMSYSLLEKEKLPEKMPKSVVILDDIFTTGATVESCARVLKEGGVERVTALTLFTAA